MKTITEVRTDFIDDDNFNHVDCWTDDKDQGKTVAIVCRDTKKVFFIDDMYRQDKEVKQAIQEILNSIDEDSDLKSVQINLNETIINKKQVRGMVHDRNNLYKALCTIVKMLNLQICDYEHPQTHTEILDKQKEVLKLAVKTVNESSVL